MKKGKLENKAFYPGEDKSPISGHPTPGPFPFSKAENGEGGGEEVKIRMKAGRAVDGIGPGECAVVSRQMAEYLISIGYATKED